MKKKTNFLEVLIFLFSFSFFLFNARYLSYPDEFVNLLAGRTILSGMIPYRDFFDHHFPFAWYLGALFLIFSGNSFVLFRLLWSIFSFGLLLKLAFYIKRNYYQFYSYYLLFIFLYPILALYFWFHLYLADSLAVLFFSIIFWLLLVNTLSDRIETKVLYLCSFLTFSLIFSSLTFLYLALFLYLWQLYLLVKSNRNQWGRFILFSLLPYGLYVFYLFLTNSWYDFYFSNFVYNTKLYISIPNYTRGRFFNPLKFAFTLIDNFYQGYLPLLSKIKHLDLFLPIDTLSALGTLMLLIFLLIKNPLIGFFYFFILSFSAPRSNISHYQETDYQSSLFFVLGLISALFSLFLSKTFQLKDTLFNDLKRLAMVVLSIFLIFSLIFLLGNFYHKFFQVYTQKMPSISNQSFVALFLSEILNKGDYFWIGPYEPDHEFFASDLRLPGKYPTLLPQFKENDYLKNDFLKQFTISMPKVIIFKHQASIFMTPADDFGQFFLSWIKDKYTPIEKIKGVTILKSPSEFDLRTDLYLRDDLKSELLFKLREKGYLSY